MLLSWIVWRCYLRSMKWVRFFVWIGWISLFFVDLRGVVFRWLGYFLRLKLLGK